MAAQLSACLPRLLALALLALLGSATATFAASRSAAAAEHVLPAAASKPAQQSALVVPDVRGRPYVFAKSALEEAGFTWRVVGRVQGFSANTVIRQQPPPGARLVDTGSPTILLGLARSPQYSELGTPENASPYPGSAVRPVADAPQDAAP